MECWLSFRDRTVFIQIGECACGVLVLSSTLDYLVSYVFIM